MLEKERQKKKYILEKEPPSMHLREDDELRW